MAVYWTMAAECGPAREAARRMAAHFDGLPLLTSGGLRTTCAADLAAGADGNWWCVAVPLGANLGVGWDTPNRSRPELVAAGPLKEIGQLLYERLRGGPAFRFAWFGREAQDAFSFGELEAGDPAQLPGLVVSEKVWEHLGREGDLPAFRPGYYWRPYEGEAAV